MFLNNSQYDKLAKCIRLMNEGFLDWYSAYQMRFVDNQTINETMLEKQQLLETLSEATSVLSEVEQSHKEYNDYCREYQRAKRRKA